MPPPTPHLCRGAGWCGAALCHWETPSLLRGSALGHPSAMGQDCGAAPWGSPTCGGGSSGGHGLLGDLVGHGLQELRGQRGQLQGGPALGGVEGRRAQALPHGPPKHPTAPPPNP